MITLLAAASGGGISLAADSDRGPSTAELNDNFQRSSAELARQLPRSRWDVPKASSASVRDESARAFRGQLSAKEVRDLVRKTAPALTDPGSHVPAAASVEGILNEGAVQLKGKDGQPGGAMITTQPIAVPQIGRDGLQLADTSWQTASDGRIEVKRPAISVTVGKHADEPLVIGDVFKLAIAPKGDAAATSTADVADQTVIYPNVATDTDVLIRSTTVGVQIGWQIRSDQAPETLDLPIELPEGARLKQLPGDGVAIVGFNNTQLGALSPVSAQDADGRSVPSRLEVVDNGLLRLHVEHRKEQFRYGIVADPLFFGDWNSGNEDFSVWSPQESVVGTSDGLAPQARPPATPGEPDALAGLWVIGSGTSSTSMYAGWVAVAPGDTSPGVAASERAWFWRMDAAGINYGLTGATNAAADPGPAIGLMYANGTWDTRTHYRNITENGTPDGIEGAENAAPAIGTPANSFNFHQRHYLGTNSADPITRGNGTQDNRAMFSLVDWGTNGTGPRPVTWLQMSWAALYAYDNVNPTITSPAQTPGWMDENDEVRVSGNDKGTGVYSFAIAPATTTTILGTGTVDCPAQGRTLCPFTATGSIPVGDVPQGVGNYRIAVGDGGGRLSAFQNIPLKIDKTAPAIALSNALYTNSATAIGATEQRQLTVTAVDGNPSGPDSARQSGVEQITIEVDGELVSTTNQSASGDSQPLTANWTPAAGQLSTGNHEITVTVTDRVGHVSEQRFTTTGSVSDTQLAEQSYALGNRVWGFGDANGDTVADLLLVDKTTGDIATRLGDGTGLFGDEAAFGSFGSTVAELASGDVDGIDADLEQVLAVDDIAARNTSGNLKLRLSEGDTFAAPGSTSDPLQATWPTDRGLAVADIDGDDSADLWGVDPGDHGVRVALGWLKGFTPSANWGTVPAGVKTLIGDLDADGRADLVTYDATTGTIKWGKAGSSSFASLTTWDTGPTGADVAIGDIDGDGDADFVFRASGGTVTGRLTGSSGFVSTPVPLGTIPTTYGIAIADVTGDGDEDVIGTRNDAGTLKVLISLSERALAN